MRRRLGSANVPRGVLSGALRSGLGNGLLGPPRTVFCLPISPTAPEPRERGPVLPIGFRSAFRPVQGLTFVPLFKADTKDLRVVPVQQRRPKAAPIRPGN